MRGRGGAAPLSGARPGGQWPPGLEAALRRSARRVPRQGMAALLPAGPPPDELDFIQAYEEVREKYKGTAPPAPRTLRATCRPAGPWQVLQPDGPASDPLSAVAGPIAPQAEPSPPPRGSRSTPAASASREEAGAPGGAPAVMPLIGHRAARVVEWAACGSGGWRGQCPVSPVCAQQTGGSRPSPPVPLSRVPPPWGGGGRPTWQWVTYLWPLLTSPNGPAPRLPPFLGRERLTPLLCPLGWQLWAGEHRTALSSFSEELAPWL